MLPDSTQAGSQTGAVGTLLEPPTFSDSRMPTYPHCSLKDFRQEVNWEDRLASLTDSSLGNTSRVPPECNEGSKQDTARQVPSQKKSPCLLGIPYNRAFWLFAFCSGLCKGK